MPTVSVTRFRVRGWRFLPSFMIHAQRSLAQIRRAEGFVAGAVRRDRDLAFWTMTVWRDEEAMLAYVHGGAHRTAMPRLANWGSQASTVRWDQDGTELPDWPGAIVRMRDMGRPLPLHHPGPGHAEVRFDASEAAFTTRISTGRDAATPIEGQAA